MCKIYSNSDMLKTKQSLPFYNIQYYRGSSVVSLAPTYLAKLSLHIDQVRSRDGLAGCSPSLSFQYSFVQ